MAGPDFDSQDLECGNSAMRAEMDELVADIRESHADIAAGRVATAAETFADVHKQLDLGRD
jgi:hypothetical protein